LPIKQTVCRKEERGEKCKVGGRRREREEVGGRRRERGEVGGRREEGCGRKEE